NSTERAAMARMHLHVATARDGREREADVMMAMMSCRALVFVRCLPSDERHVVSQHAASATTGSIMSQDRTVPVAAGTSSAFTSRGASWTVMRFSLSKCIMPATSRCRTSVLYWSVWFQEVALHGMH